jgi:Flp pilus assembly protein TadD
MMQGIGTRTLLKFVLMLTSALLCLLLIILSTQNPSQVRAAASPHSQSAKAVPVEPKVDIDSPTVTWSHDIAPIVYKNCTTCHHTGGAGPFNLLTYGDAKRWAPQMLRVTQSRFMPPWLPEPGYGNFADVRRLSDTEIALIKRWANEGMQQGDMTQAPQPPHYDATWQLGKPDLILTMDKPFALQANGTDVFSNLIFPNPLRQTRYVRAMEILPGTPRVVHHANVLIDRTASLRRKHPEDWQTGVPGMELVMDAGNKFDPDSHFLFWKPDSVALVEPEGMPWRLDPGNDLILNIHLKPSGKPESIQAQLGLYFTDKPPTLEPMLVQLDRDDLLNIPPGEKNFVVEDRLTLPVDVKVLGIYPHTHYLGRDMQGWAILPNGEKKWLVWIKDWDINRQAVYRYDPALELPKGTVLYMKYTFDNSAENLHNPNSPPVWVHAGNRSEDEMSHMWLQVLPINTPPGSPDPRLLIEEAWMRNRLRKSPHDRVTLYNLAAALSAQGRAVEAIAVYDEELKLAPGDVRTLTARGVAENAAGKVNEARKDFEQAIAGKGALPEQLCDARFDLASLDFQHQEYTRADSEYQELLANCTPDVEAHIGLAQTLAAEGKSGAAEMEYRSALELESGNLKASLGLGSLLLDAGKNHQAMRLLSDAIAANPESEDAHEQLARAYAQSGSLDRALNELKTAASLKPEDPQVHSALSQVNSALGNSESAIFEQRLALKLNDNDPDGWNNLGVLLARSGNSSEARAAFEHTLKLAPDHAEAKANLARLDPTK